MRSYVQVLTTPTADTPGTTLLLHFDNKRYLIGNLAEGTQRACVQMGAKLAKVSQCFLTGRTEWGNTGGLIGMILSLADISAASQASSLEEALKKARVKAKREGIPDDSEKMRKLEQDAKREAASTLSIFGPPNLNHTLATARRFVFRKSLPVDVHEIRDETAKAAGNGEKEDWEPLWADGNIKVWALSISPSQIKKGQTLRTTAQVSPRKRSIGEVYAADSGPSSSVADELSIEERNYLTVKAVVSEMFNSSWRLDTLHETPLSEVKLPATIFVRNANTNKIEKYKGPLPGGSQPIPDPNIQVLVRRPWPGALVESLPETEPSSRAISYIIRSHTQRGKFLPARAKELKVKMGHAWACLAKGESVQNEEGQTVTPDMVLEPNRVGAGLAIVDLPSVDYIDNLVGRQEWRELAVMEGVGSIFWICGNGVASDPRIHEFMKEFGSLEHIVSSPDYCPNSIAFDSVGAATVRLNQVDPDRYGVPVHDSESTDGSQEYEGSSRFSDTMKQHPLPKQVHVAVRGQMVQLEPTMGFHTKEVVAPLCIPKAAAEVSEQVRAEATKAQEALKVPDGAMETWQESLPPGAKDVEIIALGTGSALPSKYRNVSATLVRVPNWGNILLDCGENTLGQLKRVFSQPQLKEVLRDLRIICISHMHADHHLGTTSVIKAWYDEVHDHQPATAIPSPTPESCLDFEELFKDNRLAVISEPAMQQWLAEYSSVEDYGYSRLAPLSLPTLKPQTPTRLCWFVPPSVLKYLSAERAAALLKQNEVPLSLVGLSNIQAVQVKHCHGARAVSITLPSGFKVSYSGDCRPSNAFVRIGKGSTVCIHEATFDDEMLGDAMAKNHSTTSEALGVAQRMRAKACVLTHFSQRYQKMPVLEHSDGEAPEEEEEDTTMLDDEAQPEPTDAEEAPMDGPTGDVAATFPDQQSADGGQQYHLPLDQIDASEVVKLKVSTDMKVCAVSDYMRVKVGDIGHVEKFTPALVKLFADEEAARKREAAETHAALMAVNGGKKDKKKNRKHES